MERLIITMQGHQQLNPEASKFSDRGHQELELTQPHARHGTSKHPNSKTLNQSPKNKHPNYKTLNQPPPKKTKPQARQ